MITLIASIAGFISSLIPELFRFFKDKYDKKHELAILDKQIEYNNSQNNRILEEINIMRDMHTQASLYSTYKSGVYWVDALNGTVRPLLAYSFFVMYVGVKYMQYNILSLHLDTTFQHCIEIIWNTDDQAIFASIISFYFGQRTFSKSLKNTK